jgi:predicted DNA-binding transcriptional regulator YafY
MANTSSRTLRLLSLLQTHRYWPGGELAGRLEVSLRTLRRDIDRLRDLGYPVDARRGVDGGYQLAPGAAMPPLLLDDDEAVALAVGLIGAAQSPISGVAESSARALAKIVQVMPKRLRRRVDAMREMTEPLAWASPGPRIDPDLLTSVAQACRDRERIEFGYTAAGGAVTERRVEPHRLVSVGRRWYLVGYDLTRHDWRSFRLDRLSAAAATGVPFAPRRLPAEDAAAFVRSGLERGAAPYRVEAVVDASAEATRARIGRWAEVGDRAGGGCTVMIQAESLDWAMVGLVATQATFRVLGPPEFVAYLRTQAERFSAAVLS